MIRRMNAFESALHEQRHGIPASLGESINVSLARDRMLEFFERDQVPGDVRATLAAALNGDLHLFERLCNAMLDTWPKLQKGINEIARLVSIAPWKVIPFADRGEKPTPEAEKLAKEIETLIWTMKPNTPRMERGFEGTVKDLAVGHYYGHTATEIRWTNDSEAWHPRATRPLSARFYGYPDGIIGEGKSGEDRLMFDPSGGWARRFEDFPEHRFLIGINSGHRGHPAMAAPLRALAAYWLAAVYGLRWFIDFSQIYGVPWRHATVANGTDRNVVERALAGLGSRGYIITESGVEIKTLQGGSSGQSLPQRELIELADKQCDIFILGQTLTSGTDNSGSRALGEVHESTKNGMIDAVADFVGEILTHQLVPAIAAVNWGDAAPDNLPQIWAKREEARDDKSAAERIEILGRIGVPMGKQYVYDELGVPVPGPDEELFQPAPDGARGDPETGAGLPHETKETAGKSKPEEETEVEAADSAPTTIDRLSSAVLENLTGVASEWLSPVKPYFERLAALALSDHVTDDDFVAALERSQREIPELFDRLNHQALEVALEEAMSSAVLAGGTQRYEK